jgi:hypothetical protein
MKNLNKITLVSELISALNSGVVCLTDHNDNKQTRFQYLTTNNDFVLFHAGDMAISMINEKKKSLSSDVIVAFDLLTNKITEIIPQQFTGFVHKIASFVLPTISTKKEVLALDKNDFVDESMNKVEFLNVINHASHNLLFGFHTENGLITQQVNDTGESINGKQCVFNKPFLLSEKDGYVLYSKKQEPVWVNKELKGCVNLTGKAKLFPAIAIIDEKNHAVDFVLLANEL